MFGKTRVQGTVRSAASSLSEFLKNTYDRVKAECFRRVPVPDPVTGRWRRPRPKHTEGPARQLLEEDDFPQTSKKQATKPHLPRRARVAEPWTNRQNDSGAFTTAPVHWPVVYRNTTSPVRQTRVYLRQPSACFTNVSERRVMIWNL